MHLERNSFQAEVCLLQEMPSIDTLDFQQDPDTQWPRTMTETEFMVHLCNIRNGVWQLSSLQTELVGMRFYKIVASSCIGEAELKEMERVRLEHIASMKLLKHMAQKTPTAARSKKRRVQVNHSKAASSTDDRGSCSMTAKSGCKPCDKSSSSSSSSSHFEPGDKPLAISQRDLADDGDMPGPRRHDSTFRVGPNERVLEWVDGRFPLCRLMRRGVVDGWSIVCGQHRNENCRSYKTHCKKSITAGGGTLTEEEAVLRLKRWLVQGKLTALTAGKERAAHIALGGKQLRDLASDVAGWDELDADLPILLRTI